MTTKKAKLEIVKHGGVKRQTEVSDYDPKEMFKTIQSAQLNASSDHMVLIGDVIIDARTIESVHKIEAE